MDEQPVSYDAPCHTDIRSGDWIDRRLPPCLRPYARLLRLDRPIGAWLLLLPCWWSVALASPEAPSLYLLALFAVGAVVMRGAGCIVNDIYDRELDAKVERTKTRPLASGALGVWPALLFLIFMLLLGSSVLLQFNFFTRALAASSLVLVFTYPLAKRVVWWPQLVLGLAFNWGALVGWSAVADRLALPAILLYVGGIFWTLAYDTMYAHQDARDDIMVGVKSLAIKLGKKSRSWITFFFVTALGLFYAAGVLANEGIWFHIIFLGAVFHAAWQMWGWQMDDAANCLQRFCSNRDFGLILFAAYALGRIV